VLTYHEIILNILHVNVFIFCAVAICLARKPDCRSAHLSLFLMSGIDLASWSFFEPMIANPDTYKIYLIVALVFLNINAWVLPKTTLKIVIFLIALISLHYLEWIDIRDNPNSSFIDMYYSTMVLVCYLIYNLSSIGGLRDAWKYHQLHKYDRILVPIRSNDNFNNDSFHISRAFPMDKSRNNSSEDEK